MEDPLYYISLLKDKVSSSYHFCVEYFSQLSFDSEMFTKSETAADFVYISESNESWEKYSTQRNNQQKDNNYDSQTILQKFFSPHYSVGGGTIQGHKNPLGSMLT